MRSECKMHSIGSKDRRPVPLNSHISTIDGTMHSQGNKQVKMITFFVVHLDRWNECAPFLRNNAMERLSSSANAELFSRE